MVGRGPDPEEVFVDFVLFWLVMFCDLLTGVAELAELGGSEVSLVAVDTL